MSRVVALVVALVLSPAFVARSGAADLAPKRASDLRTLSTSRRGCPNLAVGLALDTVQNPDGTTAPFVMPPGTVFIVTSWEWVDCTGTADNRPAVVLLFANTDLNGSLLSLSSGTTTSTSSENCSASVVQTPGGVAVKSGTTLCFSDGNTNASVLVHGFIARDN